MPRIHVTYRVISDRTGLYLHRVPGGWSWGSGLRSAASWSDRESLLADLREVQADPFLCASVLDGSVPFIEGIMDGETVHYSELPEPGLRPDDVLLVNFSFWGKEHWARLSDDGTIRIYSEEGPFRFIGRAEDLLAKEGT